jgi:Flp pilus assembly pilin Flp
MSLNRNTVKTMKKDILKDETGQGMTEYVLLVLLIALIVYFGVQMYGGKLGQAYTRGAAAIAR